MSQAGFITVTQYATTAAFAVIAALTLRDWLVTRDRTRMYLALAIGSLAAVSVLGQVAKALGPSFVAAEGYVAIIIFLVSGLALLLFRHTVIPLAPRTLRVILGVVITTPRMTRRVRGARGMTVCLNNRRARPETRKMMMAT